MEISEEPSSQQPPLYMMIEDLKRGVLPHNDQLVVWLEMARRSPALDSGSMSPAGQQLMRDVQELLRLLVQFVKERNEKETLQSFAYHTSLSANTAQRELRRISKI